MSKERKRGSHSIQLGVTVVLLIGLVAFLGYGINLRESLSNKAAAPETFSPLPISSCIHATPTLIINPPSQNGDHGEGLVYDFQVINHDSPSCPPTSFSLEPSLTPGIGQIYPGGRLLMLNPGVVQIEMIKFWPSSSAPVGPITISGRVYNNNDTSLMATASAVYYNQFNCFPQRPSISITPPVNTGAAGEGQSYQVTVTNHDRLGCAAKQFIVDGEQETQPGTWQKLSAFWTQSPLSYPLSLSGGESQTRTITIAPAATTIDGSYAFAEFVRPKDDPGLMSYITAAYIVQNPTATPSTCTASCEGVNVTGSCTQGSPCKTSAQKSDQLPAVTFGLKASGCQSISIDTSTNQFTGSDTPRNTWLNAAIVRLEGKTGDFLSNPWNFCNDNVCWTFGASQTLYWRLRDPNTNQVKAVCQSFSAPAPQPLWLLPTNILHNGFNLQEAISRIINSFLGK